MDIARNQALDLVARLVGAILFEQFGRSEKTVVSHDLDDEEERFEFKCPEVKCPIDCATKADFSGLKENFDCSCLVPCALSLLVGILLGSIICRICFNYARKSQESATRAGEVPGGTGAVAPAVGLIRRRRQEVRGPQRGRGWDE